MNASTFEAFQTDAHAAGFDDALEHHWAPNTVLETHSHAFDAEAVVTQGENEQSTLNDVSALPPEYPRWMLDFQGQYRAKPPTKA